MTSTAPAPSRRLAKTRAALERHRDYLALLHAVAHAANEATRLDQALAEVVDMTCESLGWPVGHAMAVDDDNKPIVRPTDAWYLEQPALAPFKAATEALSELGVITDPIELGEVKSFVDVTRFDEFRRREVAAELGLRHLFVGPIRSGDEVIAVLEFLTPTIENDRIGSLEMLLGSICATVGRVAEREVARRQRRALLRVELERQRSEQHARELEELTEQLRQRNAELDQFAYVASHDLRAPLRGIANLASWLAKDLEPHLTDDTRRYLSLLEGRVKRMEGLINGLLEYSRVGRDLVPAEPVDVRRLVREVIDLLGAQATAQWDIGALPELHTRRLPLRQVFHNLMSNAIKHASASDLSESPRSPADAGPSREDLRVAITAERCTLAAGVAGWRFSVRDNGEGIDPRYHARVWQIFQTLLPRDQAENTGIGLSLVRKIVEQHGGSVALASTPGHGATFTFTWPTQIDD